MSAVNRLSSLFSVVYVTVPTLEIGKKIAREAVEKKLAACVNIIPQVTSIYSWNDKIEEDNELLLIIKTQSFAIEELKKQVIAIHPYDVPEFIALPIEHGSEPYLKWIHEQTTVLDAKSAGKSTSADLANKNSQIDL